MAWQYYWVWSSHVESPVSGPDSNEICWRSLAAGVWQPKPPHVFVYSLFDVTDRSHDSRGLPMCQSCYIYLSILVGYRFIRLTAHKSTSSVTNLSLTLSEDAHKRNCFASQDHECIREVLT